MGDFRPFGEVRGEKLEMLVDGVRVRLVDWDKASAESPLRRAGSGQLKTIDVRCR